MHRTIDTAPVERVYLSIGIARGLVHQIHEGFDNEDNRDKHGQGWEGCLANLEAFLA